MTKSFVSRFADSVKEDVSEEAFQKFYEQFRMGLKVESEHSKTVDDNIVTIARIALDHLEEDPEYYTKLTAAKL